MPRPISYAVFCLDKKRSGPALERAPRACGAGHRRPPAVRLLRPSHGPMLYPLFLFLALIRRPLIFTLFPYTTLFRSQITLKQMLRDFIGIRVNRAKKSGMVNITSSVNSRERSGI